MAEVFDRRKVVVGEVEVRPARPDERRRWDALVAEHHYLGFRQFAGRGLRHVAAWNGHWLALLGWQSGAFKCAPRDRWVGWHRSVQFRRLHLIGNNTRFVVLPEASGIANLASRALSRSLRRLSADWEAAHGHPLELAETFVDPERFAGTCYAASNWTPLGLTKGFARSNGTYTDPHGSPKAMHVRPLRRDARRRLADPADRPEWACRATPVRYAPTELRSLREVFAALPDSRRGQGRKHALPTVLSICLLAKLSGLSGPVAAAQFAAGLGAKELRALGAWRSADGEWAAPSAATICRVMANTDPDALEAALREWAAPRLAGDADPPALAADGKRIRGANRHTDGDGSRAGDGLACPAAGGSGFAGRCAGAFRRCVRGSGGREDRVEGVAAPHRVVAVGFGEVGERDCPHCSAMCGCCVQSCAGASCGPEDRWPRLRPVIVLVRVRVAVYMRDRWTVDGEHWEDLGSGPYVRYTSVTDCAWRDSFNVLGS